ncbi:MAG: hypothetical protein ACFFAO_16790, partial [Candidatus Hermodarchaeota archaeon]
MVFLTGDNKIVKIGNVPNLGGFNALEMILRESGRFIIRSGTEDFIAISEKRTRSIPISGTISPGGNDEHFYEYDETPVGTETQFESAQLFPQDLLNEYKIDEIEIYGLMLLCNLDLSAQPAGVVARLKGVHANYWITRQPVTSWNPEDCVGVLFSAYNTIPEKGLSGNEEGVVVGSTKKKLIPVFVPIKSSFSVDKTKDKVYLYSDVAILGYCPAP